AATWWWAARGRSRKSSRCSSLSVSIASITTSATSALPSRTFRRICSVAVPSRKSRLEDLDAYRSQVLAHPPARGISPADTRNFLSTVPRRRYPRVAYAERGGFPCVQPRGGFPLFESQLHLTRALSDAGADFVPLTIDSYTRQNEYETATQLLRRS